MLVDAMTTVACAAPRGRVALHNRISAPSTHAHFDHFSTVQHSARLLPARAIATPKTADAMTSSPHSGALRLAAFRASAHEVGCPEPYADGTFTSRATNCALSSRATPIARIQRLSVFHRIGDCRHDGVVQTTFSMYCRATPRPRAEKIGSRRSTELARAEPQRWLSPVAEEAGLRPTLPRRSKKPSVTACRTSSIRCGELA